MAACVCVFIIHTIHKIQHNAGFVSSEMRAMSHQMDYRIYKSWVKYNV